MLLVLRAGPVGIIRNLDDRLVDGEVELSVADSLITILISNNVKCGPRTKEGPVNLAVAVTIVAIIITPVVCDALTRMLSLDGLTRPCGRGETYIADI